MALNYNNFIVREKAAETLGEIGDPIALNSLKEVLNDENIYVRKAAEEAIKMIQKKNA
jgi:HEAT repeat protein